MESAGGQELLMPALPAERKLAKTGRWETLDSAFPVYQPLFQN